MKPHSLIFALFLAVSAAAALSRAACDVDSTFAANGLRTYSSPSGGSAAAGNDLLVLSDGRLLVAGGGLNAGGDKDAAWWVLDSAGTLIASASYDGLWVAGKNEEFLAAAQAPGGGPIYLAGYASDGAGNTSAVLARLNFPALTLDTSFGNALGSAGHVTVPAGTSATGVAVDSSGRAYTLEGGSLTRWTTSGALAGTFDSSFGGGSYQFDAAGQGQDLQIDGAGRLVVAGAVAGGVALWRVRQNASLDPSFGTAGKVSVAVATLASFNAVLVEAGDGVLATGFAYDPVAPKNHWVMMRLDAQGQPRAGFGTAGLAQGAEQSNLFAIEGGNGALVNTDGTLLMTGIGPNAVSGYASLWHLLGSGALDISSGSYEWQFGSAPGAMIRPRNAGANAYATGFVGTGMALWRLAACGIPPAPAAIVPSGTSANRATAFPSPARDHVTFALQLDQAADVRLEVYDERGVRLSSDSRSFGAGTLNWRLDLSGFAPGVYLYRLKPSAGSTPEPGKFVVRP